MPTTALIISGGGFQGMALVKALRAAGSIRVLLADCYAENVSRYFADGFFQVPKLDPPQPFLECVLEVCAREGVTAVFAATHYELRTLALHREAFAERGATVHVSDLAVLDLADDKRRFYGWLEENALPCLPWYDTPDDPHAVYPLIGKPRRGWGGRGIQHLDSRDGIPGLTHEEANHYIWQKCLPEFDEYSVDFAVDGAGRVSALAFRRRIRMQGGFAILCEPGAPSLVREVAERTIAQLLPLGARGPMNLQLLCNDKGCWVSDFNPRIGTSMPLSLVSGPNPMAFLMAEGGKVIETPVGDGAGIAPETSGARTFRFLEERHVPPLGLSDVRGVIFDLDDTLLDQKEWMLDKLEITWTEARHILPAQDVFLALGLRIIEEGNRARLFDAVCVELGLGDAERTHLIQLYRAARPARGLLYADVRPSLAQLRRLGYRLGVLTDNPPESQRMKMEVCGLVPDIDAVLYTGELGANKPDARTFNAAAAALGIQCDRLVMVGDNLYRDIEGALMAGYRHAFLIQRAGAIFNFNPTLAARAGVDIHACTSISGLYELMWHLTGA